MHVERVLKELEEQFPEDTDRISTLVLRWLHDIQRFVPTSEKVQVEDGVGSVTSEAAVSRKQISMDDWELARVVPAKTSTHEEEDLSRSSEEWRHSVMFLGI